MGVRTSHEAVILEHIRKRVTMMPNTEVHCGMTNANRIAPPSWEMPAWKQFQFGDLRFESPFSTVVIEAESAGGVTNLVKYWPYLAELDRQKRFVLVHLFLVSGELDYMSHRKLWKFLVSTMRTDLASNHDVHWLRDWEACLFTYRKDQDPTRDTNFIRYVQHALSASSQSGTDACTVPTPCE